MSRYIDSLPAPARKRDMKVLVVSCGRNGTMGLNAALGILGFRPFHMKNVMFGGVPQFKLMTEASRALHFGESKRYSREDFDKWFADFDAVTDLNMFLLEDLLKAYPEAKCILTLRNEDAWLKSVYKTFVPFQKIQTQFPFNVLMYFDTILWNMFKLQRTNKQILFNGDHDNVEYARQYYRSHNEKVQKLVPKERLLIVNLEDGLGWEQICPFLGIKQPDVPYPRMNNADEFTTARNMLLRITIKRVLVRASAILVAAAAFGTWYYMKHG